MRRVGQTAATEPEDGISPEFVRYPRRTVRVGNETARGDLSPQHRLGIQRSRGWLRRWHLNGG
jgi:hypothetical protein